MAAQRVEMKRSWQEKTAQSAVFPRSAGASSAAPLQHVPPQTLKRKMTLELPFLLSLSAVWFIP
jgi:hypothetical protein